jgi:V8-like Glu-specific endopeptidase
MKKLIALTSGIVLLTSCSSQSQLNFLADNQIAAQSVATNFTPNPEFTRKLKERSNYRVKITNNIQSNSICGSRDLQQVNSYDGKLGATVEFVAEHKGAVGAMEDKNKDNSSKFCSGTLIAEDLFLTASHCVDSTITKKFVSFNYEKVKGGSALAPQSHFKIIKLEEEGALKNIDYSIIRLEGKPGAKFGFTKVRTATPDLKTALTIIQHPSGEPKQIEAGTVASIGDVYMGYGDLDTEPGSSGSGVLDKDGFVTGVHTNGGCGSTSGENTGVRLAAAVKVSPILQGLDNPPTPADPTQP